MCGKTCPVPQAARRKINPWHIGLGAAAGAAAVALVWVVVGALKPPSPGTEVGPKQATRPDLSMPGPYPVVRVIDGDTIVVNIAGKDTTVRLIGVDTPQTKHPQKPVEYFGQEASRFTTDLLDGKQVLLGPDPHTDPQNRNGGTLAYVFRSPDLLLVNAEIIRQGYGHAYTRYRFMRMEEFRKLERSAREGKKGLWANRPVAVVKQPESRPVAMVKQPEPKKTKVPKPTTLPVTAPTAEGNPFEAPVLDVRPRVFLRRGEFDGLTVAKLRKAAASAEFRAVRSKWRRRPMGRAIEWMIGGKAEDLQAAISGLKQMRVGSGSWSGRGLGLVKLATLYDWLYDRLDADTRKVVAARIEKAADDAVVHITQGKAPFFYSRTPGALAGVTVAGIALKGVSPKAEGYLKLFRTWGVNEYFKAYQWVDGAATGATYTMYYTYVDLSWICAAWWSATGRNPAVWIRQRQGDWLGGIVRFNLWSMRPGFAFTDINDLYKPLWGTHEQFCQGLDIATYVTRDRHGRAWAQRWLGRFGSSLYHTEYAHNFLFRDITLPAAPLTDLPLAALFGRDSCGYGFFRSAWPAPGQPDGATHVFFRMGDPMNVHGGVSAGEFQVFRHTPLADRSGKYGSTDSPDDQYHYNCISTNVVLFTEAGNASDRGDQNTRRGLKTNHKTWAQWEAIRKRYGHDVACITDWQVGKTEARCRADLTRTNPPAKCAQWERELVWLGNRHLIVLDVVRTAKADVRRQWQLHCPTAPELGDRLITVTDEAPGKTWADPRLQPKVRRARLFCRTLAPKEYTLVVNAKDGARAFGPGGQAKGAVAGNPFHRKYGKHVVQIDPGTTTDRTVFLHVLTAEDATGAAAAPKASYRVVKPGRIEVTVAGLRTQLTVPDWFGK